MSSVQHWRELVEHGASVAEQECWQKHCNLRTSHPWPITRGVKERTSDDDRKGTKEERSVAPCEDLLSRAGGKQQQLGGISPAVNVRVIKNLGKLF